MPGTQDWKRLASETVRTLDPEDVHDVIRVDWRQAERSLLGGRADDIGAEKDPIKRFLRGANAVLFGLLRLMAPARRVLLVAALLFTVLGTFELEDRFSVNLSGQLVAVAILFVLLILELVDKVQFKDELLLARSVQSDLIPQVPPEVPGLEIAAFNRSANTVGGDLYDFLRLPDGSLFVVFGDASGHGMAAGLVMAVAHTAVRTQIETDSSPEAVAVAINRILCKTGACRTAGARQFFAGVILTLAQDGRYRMLFAGHPPVLQLSPEGTIARRLGRGAYPFGVKENATFGVEEGVLAPGEALVFHSDGLPEARDSFGHEYGDARVEAILTRAAHPSAAGIVGELTTSLFSFLGRRALEDDVSIAVIRRKP